MLVMRIVFCLPLLFLSLSQVFCQQLDTLEGGIIRWDAYSAPDGFYAFWPAGQDLDGAYSEQDSLGLVIFTHGYGALNPLNYGSWLRHIVEQGNVVIYPRYQRNLVMPSSKAFAKTVVTGITDAYRWLDNAGLPVRLERPIYVGHSYGGTLTAYILATETERDLPPAYAALLAAPGTSRLKGSRLANYASINPMTPIVIVSHEGDVTVGDEFAELVFATSADSAKIVWIHQSGEDHGIASLGQGHNECYALDEAFDTGYRNYTTRRALRIGCENAIDLELYWAILDEMLEARRKNEIPRIIMLESSEFAFGNWEDGKPRQALPLKSKRHPKVQVSLLGPQKQSGSSSVKPALPR